MNNQALEAAHIAYFDSQKPVRDFNYAAQDFLKASGIKLSGIGSPFYAHFPWTENGIAPEMVIDMGVSTCNDTGNLEKMEAHALNILKCVEFVRQYRANLTK